MKKIIIGTLLLFYVTGFASEKGVALHPTPKDPIYLNAQLYSSFKKQLPSPPEANSHEQGADVKTLEDLQKSRTQSQCKMANAEVYVSLASFYGRPHSKLTDSEINKWSPFFEQVRNDADFFIQKMKKDFPRQRPFLYLQQIKPCVPKEVTGAYPSGHATLALLYAQILSELYPDQKTQFASRSLEIGMHRVLSGMHHPTDIEAGRSLANLIFAELKKSKNFNQALKAVQ